MMKINATSGIENIATVYIAEFPSGKLVEFVESVQPPKPIHEKWVLMVSSLFGCPVQCRFCDAGGFYQGKLSADEIHAQIDYVITKRFPDKSIPVKKFKIQFARMGEPAFNPEVLTVIEQIPNWYDAPGFLPSISTIAPQSCDAFFQRLLQMKKSLFPDHFQLQFSIHSTNKKQRDWLIPVKKWDFKQIAEYGSLFFNEGGRKITLNFALVKDAKIDPEILQEYFSPDIFLLKITPVNPTFMAHKHQLSSIIQSDSLEYSFINDLQDIGFEVILSIGELKENKIGSNCGQYITNYLKSNKQLPDGYTTPLIKK